MKNEKKWTFEKKNEKLKKIWKKKIFKNSLKNEYLVSFRRAAAAGDLSTVQRLVDNDNINVDCAGKNGATALHKAAEHGRSSVIRFLGRKNASINLTGGIFGGTPLQHAGKRKTFEEKITIFYEKFLFMRHLVKQILLTPF